MKTFKPLFAICLLAGLSATWSSNTSAAEGQFYLGFAAIVEDQDIRYRKSTYRKANFARGIGDHGHGDSDKNVHGLGAVMGYRWPLSRDGDVYLSGEIEGAYHSGKIRGDFEGSCRHEGPCTRYADAWPETWSLEKNYGWGATLRLGASPEFMGSDGSFYVLAGIRRVKTDFSITYGGCNVDIHPCPEDKLSINVTSKYDRTLDAWVAGAGMEKSLSEFLALQVEVRYSDYDRKKWVSLPDNGNIIVPASLSGREKGLSLRLIRYF